MGKLSLVFDGVGAIIFEVRTVVYSVGRQLPLFLDPCDNPPIITLGPVLKRKEKAEIKSGNKMG